MVCSMDSAQFSRFLRELEAIPIYFFRPVFCRLCTPAFPKVLAFNALYNLIFSKIIFAVCAGISFLADTISMSHAILLNELVEFDFEKVARVLSKAESIVYADATYRLKHCSGILVKDLPYEEVLPITHELNNMGVGCFHMAMADFYHPPQAYTLHNMYCGDDFFGGIDLYGNIQPYEWQNMVLLCCGYIEEKEKIVALESSLPDTNVNLSFRGIPLRGVSIGGHDKSIRKPKVITKKYRILDIFIKQPQEKHLRIASNSFNYDCLGRRKKPRSMENFQLVVQDICQYTASAFSNRGIRSALKTPPVTVRYNSLRAFEEESLWLLQLTYLNLKNQ